jgi:hypothetical protein
VGGADSKIAKIVIFFSYKIAKREVKEAAFLTLLADGVCGFGDDSKTAKRMVVFTFSCSMTRNDGNSWRSFSDV